MASTIATNTNKAVWKLSWVHKDESLSEFGLKIEVIHPEYYVQSPALKDNIQNCKMVGNLIYRRRREIDDKKAAGIYYSDENNRIPEADLGSNDKVGAIQRSLSQPGLSPNYKDQDLIAIWDLVVKLDLKGDDDKPKPEKYYRVLLAVDAPEVLLVEDYPHSRPMYFESAYIQDEKVYWTGRSVGFNLQPLQLAYDYAISALYNGSMAEAMPAVFGAGLPDKYDQWGYGDVINLDEALVNPPWSPPAKFSGGPALISFLQQLERIGDQTARISQNTMGSDSSGQRTATERSIIASGVATGQEEFIANFSNCFPEMATATCEMLLKYWDEWYPIFGLQPVMVPAPVMPGSYGAPATAGFDANGGLMPPDDMMGGAPAMPMGPDPMMGPGMAQMVPAIDPETGQPITTGFLDIKEDDLSCPVVWEPTGKTPGNTPQAKLQAAMMLLEAGATIPQLGFNLFNLGKVMVNASGLNADQVQYSKAEMEQMMMEQQMAQQQMMDQQNSQIEADRASEDSARAQEDATKAQTAGRDAAQAGFLKMVANPPKEAKK